MPAPMAPTSEHVFATGPTNFSECMCVDERVKVLALAQHFIFVLMIIGAVTHAVTIPNN